MFNQEFDGIVCRSADLEVALPSYNPAVAQQAHQYLDTLLAQSSACMAPARSSAWRFNWGWTGAPCITT